MNISVASVAMLLTFGCTGSRNNKDKSSAEIFSVKNMDLNVKPGNDFFEYVNGTWNKNHPIPQDKSQYDAFEELTEKNRNNILDIFKEVSGKESASADAVSRKIGNLYNSGLDTIKIEQLNLKPLEDFFSRVDNMKTIADVQDVASYLQQFGVNPFFAVFASPDQKNSSMMIANTWQTGIGLPDRDYYFKKDDASRKIREAYIVHLTKMFELLNDKPEIASANARKIFSIETQFADSSFTNVDNQDPQKTYNKFTVSQLETLAPDFNWRQFLKNIGYPDIPEFNIRQPSFIRGLDKLMKSVSVDDWKTFLRWEIINTYAPYLSEKFEKLNHNKISQKIDDDLAFLTKNLNNINIEFDDDTSESGMNSDEGPLIVTETMAEIYSMQGAVDEAIKAYETLSGLNPDRKEYFEEKISNLRAK